MTCAPACMRVHVTGVVELLQSGKLPKSHWDWVSGS